jgi:DNA-binding NarL/FixJ family response regulator
VSGPPAGAAIRLLVVDDHPVVRNGLRGTFESEPGFTVVGEAGSGEEAIVLATSLEPDVVLMDLRMPGLGGVAAIGDLRRRRPATRVVVLTTFDSDTDILPAIEAGAVSYLLKDAPADELVRAVRAAHRGESVLAPSVASRLMQQVRGAVPEPATLTARELEVLTLVAEGGTNSDVAAALFLSEASIKATLQSIYEKLGVRHRAAAVGEAYRRGLLA